MTSNRFPRSPGVYHLHMVKPLTKKKKRLPLDTEASSNTKGLKFKEAMAVNTEQATSKELKISKNVQ